MADTEQRPKSAVLTSLETQRDRIQQELEQKQALLGRLQGTQMGPPSGPTEALTDPQEVKKEIAALEKELGAKETAIALRVDVEAKEAAAAATTAAKPPTTVSTNTTEPFIVSRNPDGSLRQEPNPNYREQIGAASGSQIRQGRDGQEYEIFQGPNGLEARLIPGQPGALGAAEQPVNYSIVTNPADGSMWTVNPRTGQRGTQLFEGKSPELLDAQRQETIAKSEAIRIGTQAMQELTAALDMPAGPERDRAVEAATRKYALLEGTNGATELLRMGQQEADRKQRASDQLGKQTGIVHDPETMQPMLDPLTGAFRKTVEQTERERVAEASQASAKLAEQTQRERERASSVAEQQAQMTALLTQQREDETGRANIERELTQRGVARTGALAGAASAAGLGTGREVWTPATMAARVASQSQGMTREGVIQIAQSIGMDQNTLNAVLGGFDTFNSQQERLQSQIQPVRRAPNVGATPPQAKGNFSIYSPTTGITPAPSSPPSTPAPVGAGAGSASSQMFGQIGPNAYNWTPQPPGGPVAAAAALVPPPEFSQVGEPETVMIPNVPAVPSTLEELLSQLDLMPYAGAY